MFSVSTESGGTLPYAAARRLSNQISRAFRGTYGARTGLRTIVRSVTRQMLVAGSSPDAVARTIEHCVLNHPACLAGDPQNIMTGRSHSRMLVELTRQWVEQMALEGTSPAPTIGRKAPS